MKSKYHSLDDLPLVLRVEDLMPVLGVARNSAYALVRCGKIRSIRIGRKTRISRDAVEEFLNSNSV